MHPDTYSSDLVNFVKEFEGLHRVQPDGTISSYRCAGGRWTIGYGSTKGVRSGMKITLEEAEERLKADLDYFAKGVKNLIDVPLNQGQFDALVSFSYNVGLGALESSTLRKLLQQGHYDEVPAQLLRWDKTTVNGEKKVLKGLTRRRVAEAAMWSRYTQIGEQLSQKVEPTDTAQKPLVKSRTMAGLSLAGLGTILTETSTQLKPLIGYSTAFETAFVVVTVVGIGLAAYARISDHSTARK